MTNLEKFRNLLEELFQLDQADLDFGIYRIMNTKREEIGRFLNTDLLPQVKEAFAKYKSADKSMLQAELARLEKSIRDAGMDPADSPKVTDLKKQIAESAVDVTALENEVFSHLTNFFRRYYNEGDFISQRRYKDGVYAIPYEGEEVKLHWANADQYYVKSSEYFKDYIFTLPSGKRVRLHLMAASTEQDNNKPAPGNDRRFVLKADEPLREENGELYIQFEYKPTESKEKQDDLNRQAIATVLATPGFEAWAKDLGKADPTDKKGPSILERHLTQYTAKNTFDYFIHKNLGEFLRRELDFYIKSEVMYLDDIEHESAPKLEQYLSQIKVIRSIAHKIIQFVEQLENFQKRLWLKKKFVVDLSYLIRLDRVPEEFYPEITANGAQREEWVQLFAIDEIKKDLTGPGYSKPLKPAFLKSQPSLVLDTKHFDASFRDRLLHKIENLDKETGGLIVHGENYQALSLLQARYRGKIPCIYIDPPYNTDASAIDYKNGYKASSWMALIYDRVANSTPMLRDDGVLIAAIDDEQQRELSFILSDVFQGRLLGTICVRSNPSGRPTKTGYSVSHEYLLFAGRSSKSAIGRMPPTEEQMARFNQRDEDGVFEWRNLRREGSNSDRSARRALYYPMYLQGDSIRIPKMTWKEKTEEWIVEEKPQRNEQVTWPDNEAGEQKTWRWEWTTVLNSLAHLSVRKDRSNRDYVYYKRRPNEAGVVSVSSWFDAKYSATEHGTAVLKALFGHSPFSYPKSIHAVVDAIYIGGASHPDSVVLDYFAGSGTTGHAVINLNRREGGRRQFILAEMGEYVHTALVPRIKKVMYTPEWKDGKPLRPATDEETKSAPGIVKFIRLESYEDALTNLELKRMGRQASLLDLEQAYFSGR